MSKVTIILANKGRQSSPFFFLSPFGVEARMFSYSLFRANLVPLSRERLRPQRAIASWSELLGRSLIARFMFCGWTCFPLRSASRSRSEFFTCTRGERDSLVREAPSRQLCNSIPLGDGLKGDSLERSRRSIQVVPVPKGLPLSHQYLQRTHIYQI